MNSNKKERYLPVVRNNVLDRLKRNGGAWKQHDPVNRTETTRELPDTMQDRRDAALTQLGRTPEVSKKDARQVLAGSAALAVASVVGPPLIEAVSAIGTDKEPVVVSVNNNMNTPAQQDLLLSFEAGQLPGQPTANQINVTGQTGQSPQPLQK